MQYLSTESMQVTCNHCQSDFVSNDVTKFKESNTYPPSVHFMCLECNQMAKVQGRDIPKRLFALLVNKLMKERGFDDSLQFNSMSAI